MAAGHRVMRARTAREAIVRARTKPPNLVVIDSPLSARASSELVARFRGEPATAKTPILLLDPSESVLDRLAAVASLAPEVSRGGPSAAGAPPASADEESRLQAAALEAAANAIVITDREGRITW
jgi:CheY-like chemotaxis protein